ncbi:MAG: EF-hand domain-containing protein [Syntrophobacteraceae bacterium]
MSWKKPDAIVIPLGKSPQRETTKEAKMKMRAMSMILGLLILLVLVGTGWVAAQSQSSQPVQPAPRMRCMDRFDAMDANHDGVLTSKEFMAADHPGGHGEEVFESRDKNGDGKLSKEEFCSGKGMGRGGMGKGRMQ